MVLEGWQILPHLLRAVITPENRDKLKTIFLYKADTDDILAGIKTNVAKNDWVIKNTKEENTFLAIAKMVSYFGDHIKMEAGKYNFDAINMDFDFKQKIYWLN